MELNLILHNSEVTHIKNAEQIDLFLVKLVFLSLILVEPLKLFQIPNQQEKINFPSISDMGCSSIIKHSVQF
jgi:hypothetical protein